MLDLIRYLHIHIASFISTRRSEKGASLVEYALLVALIAVACIVAIGFLGQSAKDNFNEVGSSIAGA